MFLTSTYPYLPNLLDWLNQSNVPYGDAWRQQVSPGEKAGFYQGGVENPAEGWPKISGLGTVHEDLTSRCELYVLTCFVLSSGKPSNANGGRIHRSGLPWWAEVSLSGKKSSAPLLLPVQAWDFGDLPSSPDQQVPSALPVCVPGHSNATHCAVTIWMLLLSE